MYDRAQIKEDAKYQLKHYYWTAFLATLIAGIMGGGWLTSNFTESFTGNGESAKFSVYKYFSKIFPNVELVNTYIHLPGSDGGLRIRIDLGVIVFFAIVFAWRFFLSCPFSVGMNRFFLAAREHKNDVYLSNILYGFKNNYFNNAWAVFGTDLIIDLLMLPAWVLFMMAVQLYGSASPLSGILCGAGAIALFILAFIKRYQYILVPLVVANNSSIKGKRARELSTMLTNQHKWDLFVLALSFFGWYFLGALLCGVGVLFVAPYYRAAFAEAYDTLKSEINMTNNKVLEGELPKIEKIV